jgi:signal transduction histidine kinase/ActR/RegA family two-component response regulator
MIVLPDTLAGDSPLHRKLAGAALRSAVAVPLMVEDELFGILLTARREVNGFSNGECEFLRMLSEQVALAAHQARLHTQLQRAYDELRQTQQAVMREERLRALGQMASGIAHDINNALCPIVVYADLLLQSEKNLSESSHKHLQHIKTAGEDIAHIVSRMREFYRRREQADQVAPVSLNKLAAQVVELTRPRWRDIPQARGLVVEMRTDFGEDLPRLIGNESELREAVTNLILNAVDAMPAGGKLTLRTRARGWNHHTTGEPHPTHLVLEVSDNGVGMDEETRKRCLEPFFSTKGKRGTGLGLAMVYGVMERHEGHIEIDSELGRGTTMRLVFLIREADASGGAAASHALLPLPPLRVLFVDDEPLLRDMMREVLENGGHTVEVADGGQAGLNLFRAAGRHGEPFDVVITDLGMPYLDGRQLAQTLKRESPLTPILMLTGWGTILKEDGDVPVQVDGVLSKPPKVAELYELLAKVTKQKAAA